MPLDPEYVRLARVQKARLDALGGEWVGLLNEESGRREVVCEFPPGVVTVDQQRLTGSVENRDTTIADRVEFARAYMVALLFADEQAGPPDAEAFSLGIGRAAV